MNKGHTKRSKTGRKVIGRTRRRESNPDSEGGNSSRSTNSLNLYEWELAGTDFSFDGKALIIKLALAYNT
jgi:hypothetical protein